MVRFSSSPVSVEDFVFLVLSRRPGLSAKSVFAELGRLGVSVTYQAVHKKLKSLEKEHVLVFDGQKYAINRDWILNSKDFLENLDLD